MSAEGAKKVAANAGKKAAHPSYPAMIVSAIKNLQHRNGSSRKAILNYILANYKVDPAVAQGRVRLGLKNMMESKRIIPGSSMADRKGFGSVKVSAPAAKKSPKVARQRKPLFQAELPYMATEYRSVHFFSF